MTEGDGVLGERGRGTGKEVERGGGKTEGEDDELSGTHKKSFYL